MKVNSSIFKSYDIRGIYPQEINKKTAFKIGRAFIDYIKGRTVVVGRDMRISSPELFEGLAEGIRESGADLYNLGEVPTEVLYFVMGRNDYEGGIMITASHNPKEYNGFKMMKRSPEGFSMVRGKNLLEIIKKDSFVSSEKRGELKKLNVISEYLEYLFSKISLKGIKPLRVVFDAGNGMAGKILPLIQSKLPIRPINLNFELDGNFPAHPSNPLAEGSLQQISQKIKEEKADLGFIFDGDADRIFLIDEQGKMVPADITLLFLAKYILKENPGTAIAYNTICSKAVPEFVKKWGGKPLRTKVGFVNIREELLKNEGLLGGEASGHYCFKENFYGDSSFLTLLILLNIFSNSNRKVSEMTKEFLLYAKSPEINFEVDDKEKILEKIKEEYSDGKQDYLDGITVEYSDWWFNLRPSQTEPLLRLTIEANTEELLEKKKRELIEFINNNS